MSIVSSYLAQAYQKGLFYLFINDKKGGLHVKIFDPRSQKIEERAIPFPPNAIHLKDNNNSQQDKRIQLHISSFLRTGSATLDPKREELFVVPKPVQGTTSVEECILKEGHASVVYALQLLPNGMLASGSYDNTIKIWDPAQNFLCIHTLHGHTRSVYALQPLPNGMLASGSGDKTIKIWDPAQHFSCIHTLQGHMDEILALQLLPNGLLASGSGDNTIKIWKPYQNQNFSCVHTLQGHTNSVRALQLFPNGMLASGSYDNTIKIWKLGQNQNFSCVHTLQGHTNSVRALQLLPNGMLASGSDDKTIKIWKPDQNQNFSCVHTLQGHTDNVCALQLLPNGIMLVSGSRDKTIKTWDSTQNFSCVQTLQGCTNSIWALQLLSNGMLASSYSGTIKIWKMQVPIDVLPIIKSLEQAIFTLLTTVKLQEEDSDNNDDYNLTCPITQEMFKDPVMDEWGHTFEKEAIEKSLETSNLCPMDRRPILQLTPNLTVKTIVENLKQKPPIPVWKKGKENTNLAKQLIDQGNIFLDSGEAGESLNLYTKALQYAPDSSFYQPIPAFFEQQNQVEKASLAYLYLASYQLEEKKIEMALKSLEHAFDLYPSPELKATIALTFHLMGQIEKSVRFYGELCDHFEGRKEFNKAITFCEKSIEANPDHIASYNKLAFFQSDPKLKAYTYLRATLHFLPKDANTAEQFCKKACDIFPADPQLHFPLLTILRQGKRLNELAKKYLQLAQIYENQRDQGEVRTCYKKALELNPSTATYEKLIKSYQKAGKNGKAYDFSLHSIAYCIKEQKWKEAKKIAEVIRAQMGDSLKLLEQLNTIYSHTSDPKLSGLLARLGDVYEKKNQLGKAKSVYQRDWKVSQSPESCLALGRLLVRQHKNKEALEEYKKLSEHTFVNSQLNYLQKCHQEIEKLDHSLTSFSHQEKVAIMTQKYVLGFTNQLSAVTNDLISVKKELSTTKQELFEVKEKARMLKAPTLFKSIKGRTDSTSISALQSLPNGMLASGSGDKTIKIWNLPHKIWDPSQNFTCIHTLQGHTDKVVTLQLLTNGMLASGSWDNTIRIWDPAQEFSCIQTLKEHTDGVFTLQLLPNGMLASGSKDMTIKIWEPFPTFFSWYPTQNFTCIQSLKGHTDSVLALQPLPNGMLASGSYDRTIKIWERDRDHFQLFGDLADFSCILSLRHIEEVTTLQLLSNGMLASGSLDGIINIWDPSQKFACIHTLQVHHHEYLHGVCSLQLLPNSMLASGFEGGTIKIWDPSQNFTCIHTLVVGDRYAVRVLQTLANGMLVSGSDDGAINIWGFI